MVMPKLLVALSVAVFLFVLPMATLAADLVPCGTADEPAACQACHVVQLTNNVVSWIVMILGIIAAILIVVAGARLVTSGGNVSAKEAAKSSMTNLLIGYLIVLSAWLVLDFGLKALLIEDGSFGVWNEVSCVAQPLARNVPVTQQEVMYIPIDSNFGNLPGWTYVPGRAAGGTGGGGSDSGQTGGGTVGTWTASCTRLSGPAAEVTQFNCAAQQAQCTSQSGIPTLNTARNVVICTPRQVVISGGGGGSLPQCTNQYCSVQALMRAGMTSRQANVMSCIAITESSGNPNTPPYNVTNPGSNSSACGLFQIVRTTWNLYNVGGSCSDHRSSCQNAVCNTRVAVNIVQRNGFNDWICRNCNEKAIQCVIRYGG
jgi:hypothetical protein